MRRRIELQDLQIHTQPTHHWIGFSPYSRLDNIVEADRIPVASIIINVPVGSAECRMDVCGPGHSFSRQVDGLHLERAKARKLIFQPSNLRSFQESSGLIHPANED